MSSVALKDYPEATFNGFTKRLRLKPSINVNIYPEYIGYYLRSPKVRDQITSFSTLTTRASLNNSMLNMIEIELPLLGEQKSIGDTLSSLDEKIELNNQINKNLEEMAQAIFKSWFIDFKPFQDGEFEESELGKIPKGWKVGYLNEIGEIVGGGTPSKKRDDYYTSTGIPWVTPKDLSENKDKYISRGTTDITELGLKESSAKLMPKGTVLFSSRAPIGYIAIAKNEVTTNQGFKSVIPKKEFGSEFIYYLLKFNTELIENMATGTTFKEISGSAMKKVPIIIPNINMVKKFNDVANSLGNLIQKNEEENKVLGDIRDTEIYTLSLHDALPIWDCRCTTSPRMNWNRPH